MPNVKSPFQKPKLAILKACFDHFKRIILIWNNLPSSFFLAYVYFVLSLITAKIFKMANYF